MLIHKMICPRLKCEDCAIKDSDLYAEKPHQTRIGKCPFYESFPDGYAGGYVMKDKMTRLRTMSCPREYVFCAQCEKSDNGKECVQYRYLRRKENERISKVQRNTGKNV